MLDLKYNSGYDIYKYDSRATTSAININALSYMCPHYTLVTLGRQLLSLTMKGCVRVSVLLCHMIIPVTDLTI